MKKICLFTLLLFIGCNEDSIMNLSKTISVEYGFEGVVPYEIVYHKSDLTTITEIIKESEPGSNIKSVNFTIDYDSSPDNGFHACVHNLEQYGHTRIKVAWKQSNSWRRIDHYMIDVGEFVCIDFKVR